MKKNASIRIGLTFEDPSIGDDGQFFIRNFGSRIRWSGETDVNSDLKAIALNPDSFTAGATGASQTRQTYIGLSGGFGAVTIGAQYPAFYDMISSHTDIAWWGSCWTQFECGRQSRVLKYSGGTDKFSYTGSIAARPESPDDFGEEDPEFLDDIELGVNVEAGPVVLGAAVSSVADQLNADGFTDDGGTLFRKCAR